MQNNISIIAQTEAPLLNTINYAPKAIMKDIELTSIGDSVSHNIKSGSLDSRHSWNLSNKMKELGI